MSLFFQATLRAFSREAGAYFREFEKRTALLNL
jgi:hypothetical protein